MTGAYNKVYIHEVTKSICQISYNSILMDFLNICQCIHLLKPLNQLSSKAKTDTKRNQHCLKSSGKATAVISSLSSSRLPYVSTSLLLILSKQEMNTRFSLKKNPTTTKNNQPFKKFIKLSLGNTQIVATLVSNIYITYCW